ncbi:hypothetical protein B0J12DRAFT_697627 [Macrophomina phaseolina]|uniref:Uncharacterized protein n=1 Tax=Macrophomina phaseolina TaxID=35725 RepID=A0ABQ8GK92_9PEZI|nr:hypothetical protein B0J12DRAFT_697627 [Macrophomina phaseolina]
MLRSSTPSAAALPKHFAKKSSRHNFNFSYNPPIKFVLVHSHGENLCRCTMHTIVGMATDRNATMGSPSASREIRRTRNNRPTFEMPFPAPRLLELWNRALIHKPEHLIKWIESAEVQEILLAWSWVFYSQQRTFQAELYESSVLAERQSKNGKQDLWVIVRDELVKKFGQRKPRELEKLSKYRTEQLLDDGDSNWEDIWELTSAKLIVAGSNKNGEGKPFWDIDFARKTSCQVTLELLMAIINEMDHASKEPPETNSYYFRQLLNMSPSVRVEHIGNVYFCGVSLFKFRSCNFTQFWTENLRTNARNCLGLLKSNRVNWIIAGFIDQVDLDDTTQEFIAREFRWRDVRHELSKSVHEFCEITPDNTLYFSPDDENYRKLETWTPPWITAAVGLVNEGVPYMALNGALPSETDAIVQSCLELLHEVFDDITQVPDGYWHGIYGTHYPFHTAELDRKIAAWRSRYSVSDEAEICSEATEAGSQPDSQTSMEAQSQEHQSGSALYHEGSRTSGTPALSPAPSDVIRDGDAVDSVLDVSNQATEPNRPSSTPSSPGINVAPLNDRARYNAYFAERARRRRFRISSDGGRTPEREWIN